MYLRARALNESPGIAARSLSRHLINDAPALCTDPPRLTLKSELAAREGNWYLDGVLARARINVSL